ncbi:MAG: DUF1552 domain-containing protein [Myxococcota bacterium]|jgi:Protein of unknown function (DUF1552)|nr:DUF1552 domain-containing protein [Myxococcota bacterium]
MTTKSLDRRTVLRGLLATGGAVTIPLPLLEIMLNDNGTALAQTGAPVAVPYVTWFFGNGSLPGKWKPSATGSGAEWTLSPQLQPLADFKSHLTVISGLTNQCVIGGIEHPTGSSGATTGGPLNGNAVKGKSIDQIVADVTGTGVDFKSIQVGITPATPGGPQDSLHSVSHRGPSARNDAEYDPKKLFTKLFMDGTAPTTPGTPEPMPDAMAKLNAVKKSMLDSCLADGQALQKKLGANDRQRVEEHLEAIRRIELRLQSSPTGNPGGGTTKPAACASPVAPTAAADSRSEAPPAVNTAMAELSTLALACERTRVLTYMFSLPAAHVYYRHLDTDMNADFHDTICHGDAGDQANQPRVDKGVMYAMKCLNEFLTNFKNTSFGATTLLDASLIYVTSDTAWGKIHTKEEWPVLLLGKAGGKLKGDAHHNYPGDNLSKALLTVAKLMGSSITEIGADNGKVNATLSGIA